MRSERLALAVVLASVSSCAKATDGPLCAPVTSFSMPITRCAPTASPPAPPAPEPVRTAPLAKAVMRADKIELSETIEFETDSDRLLPSSERVLDEVTAILRAHPELTQIRIEGYTDSTSTREHNQTLSDERALSVKLYLVGRGVDTHRLSTQGFGQDHPVASNETEEGRHQNRRVDFRIVK